jgi:hypothetical protein
MAKKAKAKKVKRPKQDAAKVARIRRNNRKVVAERTAAKKRKAKKRTKAEQTEIAMFRAKIGNDTPADAPKTRAALQKRVLRHWHLSKCKAAGGGYEVYGRLGTTLLGPYRASDTYDSLLIALAHFPIEVGLFGLSSVCTDAELAPFRAALEGANHESD